MLSFENYAEYGAGNADDLVRMGGLQKDDEEEGKPVADEEDDAYDGTRAMDIDEPVETSFEVLLFPEPKPLIIYSGDSFHFDKQIMYATFHEISAQLMLALNGQASTVMKKSNEKIMAGICVQPCIPAIVHSSPLVSLFENTTKNLQPVKKPTYISFMRSCHQLHQYKMCCVAKCFPFHPTMTPEKLENIHDEYAKQYIAMEKEQNAQLDALYSVPEMEQNALLASFVVLMESFCLQYIHLIEYYLYTCLVEPHNVDGLIPIEAVLTPNVLPTMDSVRPEMRESILCDVQKFFDYKRDIMKCEQIQPIQSNIGKEMFKGYLPIATLLQYCQAMN